MKTKILMAELFAAALKDRAICHQRFDCGGPGTFSIPYVRFEIITIIFIVCENCIKVYHSMSLAPLKSFDFDIYDPAFDPETLITELLIPFS